MSNIIQKNCLAKDVPYITGSWYLYYSWWIKQILSKLSFLSWLLLPKIDRNIWIHAFEDGLIDIEWRNIAVHHAGFAGSTWSTIFAYLQCIDFLFLLFNEAWVSWFGTGNIEVFALAIRNSIDFFHMNFRRTFYVLFYL